MADHSELERAAARARVNRYRARLRGDLPPLPRCSECGKRVLTDRWGTVCAVCARATGLDRRSQQRGTPRALRLAAEAVLLELRREAKGGR